jgi:hypothetical protein
MEVGRNPTENFGISSSGIKIFKLGERFFFLVFQQVPLGAIIFRER